VVSTSAGSTVVSVGIVVSTTVVSTATGTVVVELNSGMLTYE
jgi:hypothetical protein